MAESDLSDKAMADPGMVQVDPLAEFDRHGRPAPSMPWVDLARPRRVTWWYDRYLQPRLYSRGILRGRVSS